MTSQTALLSSDRFNRELFERLAMSVRRTLYVILKHVTLYSLGVMCCLSDFRALGNDLPNKLPIISIEEDGFLFDKNASFSVLKS